MTDGTEQDCKTDTELYLIARKILTVIRDNVETNYDQNSVLADNARTLLVSEIVDRVTMLQGVVSAHVAPAGNPFTSVADRQTTLNALLTPISQETPIAPVFPYPLQFTAAGTAYTVDTEAQITAIFGEIEKKVNQYQSLTVELRERAEALEVLNQAYDDLAAIAATVH